MVGGVEQYRRELRHGRVAGATGSDGETVHPVGSQLLWGDPDPLWAVGDWRPDEVRVVTADAADPARGPRHAAAPPTRSCGSACSPRAAAHCGI